MVFGDLAKALPSAESVESGEILQVGGLNVHLLGFDHIEGAAGVPKAKEEYEKIVAQYPDAKMLIEYFPDEIVAEADFVKPKLGEVVAPSDEFGNICRSYGNLIDEEHIDDVLVADPAYNYGFVVPEALPVAIGLGVIGAAIVDVHKMAEEERGYNLRSVITLAKDVGIVGLGGTSLFNSIHEIGSGTTKKNLESTNKPSSLLRIMSEADFRILTVVHALEQLGRMPGVVRTEDLILIYPPEHIKKIKAMLQEGSENWVKNNIKFDAYKLLYSWLNIMNIREWTKEGDRWEKTKSIPVDYSFMK